MEYRHELQRKAIHVVGASLGPLIYLFIPKLPALMIAVPLMLVAILLDVLRQRHPDVRAFHNRWLGQLMRRDEDDRLCGASYVLIAIVACVWLFPKPVAVAALLFMSVSDALASLVGMRVGGPGWCGKSLAGSGAFLVSAVIIALLLVPDRPVAAVVGAVTATIVELLPLRVGRARLDDNLSVPLAGGAVMWALHFI